MLRGALQYIPRYLRPQLAQGAPSHHCWLQTCKASSHEKQGEHMWTNSWGPDDRLPHHASCNKKRTHKLLPKLMDPRDAKVRSIQQNPVTHSKLFLMYITTRKHCLMFLGLLQRCTNSINQLMLLLSKILCSWHIVSCTHHNINGQMQLLAKD